ncbi:MAG: hypothetical protein IT186_07130 [Acidobacteria bacterium]|nr:hypothetical protein [Acidobacteriota bacterium]
MEIERARLGVEVRVEFEQRFVDGAEFLGSQMGVVDDGAAAFDFDDGQSANGGEEVGVGDVGGGRGPHARQIGTGGIRPQIGPKRGNGEGGDAAFLTQAAHDELEPAPEIGVLGAAQLLGKVPQSLGAVVLLKAGACLAALTFGVVGFVALEFGQQKQITILGHEEEEQSIHNAQELAVVLLAIELAVAEGTAEAMIRRMGEETLAESADRFLDATTKLVKGTDALFAGDLGPLLQPTGGGLLALEARLMAEQPQHAEVGEGIALHHGFDVELDVGLAGEALVVTQQPQAQAVGDDSPEVFLGAVEEFLNEGVGGGLGRAGNAGCAAIDQDLVTDQVNGQMIVEMGDGVFAAIDLAGLALGRHAPKAKFLEERIQPTFAGERRAGSIQIAGFFAGLLEPAPGHENLLPGALDDLVEFLPRQEVIGVGGEPVEVLPLGNTLQQLRGQDRAFGADGGEEGTGGGAHGLLGVPRSELGEVVSVLRLPTVGYSPSPNRRRIDGNPLPLE